MRAGSHTLVKAFPRGLRASHCRRRYNVLLAVTSRCTVHCIECRNCPNIYAFHVPFVCSVGAIFSRTVSMPFVCTSSLLYFRTLPQRLRRNAPKKILFTAHTPHELPCFVHTDRGRIKNAENFFGMGEVYRKFSFSQTHSSVYASYWRDPLCKDSNCQSCFRDHGCTKALLCPRRNMRTSGPVPHFCLQSL